ncbi:hypothetical protein [Flectobacillus major]|jgi:hypothetical protein|uniref:hypothetical protein n=1 Tax=Flectobacillus major TaxID=103 RepID=UPI0004261A5F|nr:hypothetical protein [Flectobacillus major]
MKTLAFKTNITSPIGIQAVWDALKSVGVNSFNIDFADFNHALSIASERMIAPITVISVLSKLGYYCEEMSFQ